MIYPQDKSNVKTFCTKIVFFYKTYIKHGGNRARKKSRHTHWNPSEEVLWLQKNGMRYKLHFQHFRFHLIFRVPGGSHSRGGDVAVYVVDINQPSLPTPFYSVLVSVHVFLVLSTVFHSINPPDNSLLSQSVFPVLSFSYWSLQLCVSL